MKKQNLFLRKSFIGFAVFFVASFLFLSFSHSAFAYFVAPQGELGILSPANNGDLTFNSGYQDLIVNVAPNHIPYQVNYNGYSISNIFTPVGAYPNTDYTYWMCSGSDSGTGAGINNMPNTPANCYVAYFSTDGSGGVINHSLATCSDGIQNQDETGIDTGGVCSPAFIADLYSNDPGVYTANFDDTYIVNSNSYSPVYGTATVHSSGVPQSVEVYISSSIQPVFASDPAGTIGLRLVAMGGVGSGSCSAYISKGSVVVGWNVFNFSSCADSYNFSPTVGYLQVQELNTSGGYPTYFQPFMAGDNSSGNPQIAIKISSHPGNTLSPEKFITSFNFNSLSPNVTGVVNETNHTINLIVPLGTDVSALVPTITISSGASVSPNTNIAKNFSSPVTYTVTAADSSIQTYAVTVIVSPFSGNFTITNEIESNGHKGLHIVATDGAGVVWVVLPNGSPVTYGGGDTHLKNVDIGYSGMQLSGDTGSDAADIVDGSYSVLSWTSGYTGYPVGFTSSSSFYISGGVLGSPVTCSDGIQNQNETGIDTGGVCGMKAITSFNFQGLTPSVTGVVNETNHTINLIVPLGTDVSVLVPTIAISSGASVSPNTDIAQNFSSPVTYTVTAADGSMQEYTVTIVPSCTVDCFSNVLFLPGLEASRLYKQETVAGITTEDQLWEPNINSDVEDLYLNTNGTSVNPNIYTRDIIGTTNILPVFTQDIYKSLITELDNLKSTNKISDWKPFAYDWRQGIDDLVQNGTKYNDDQIFTLIGTLQSLVSTSKTGKVTIITHSNGGLLAKALIKKLEDMKSTGQNDLVDHIDNLVMVAAPQLGTPEALAGLLHGYKQNLSFGFFILMNEITARKLAQNMSSAYGFLPSQKYFDLLGINYPAVFDPSEQIYTTAYGSSIDSYQEEHNFVLGQEGRTQPADSDLISPAIGNGALLTQAENLHNSIDNMTFPPSINVISIAGWGRTTISGMTYVADDIQPITTIRGDETVVSQSAAYGQGTKYWLDLSQSTLNHGHIFEDPQLLALIDNVIEQKSSTLSNITDTEPLQSGILLAQSVHSPVSIGVYDTQGNFTGKVCDDSTGNCVVKENIPGSTYLEFGEGKYVNLSQDKVQKTVLQGTGVGTFTFNSQTISPSGQTTTSSFVNIPVTTQTQAEITLNQNSGVPQLALDVTGDGVTDFILSPSANFDPITYLQIMKATIDSLDLTQAKINTFDKRVDNIIKLIQKGKIDKAKLKADKFKSVLENKLAKPDPKHIKPKKLSKTDAQLLLDMLNKLLDNLN